MGLENNRNHKPFLYRMLGLKNSSSLRNIIRISSYFIVYRYQNSMQPNQIEILSFSYNFASIILTLSSC